jgi:hypothetical protein
MRCAASLCIPRPGRRLRRREVHTSYLMSWGARALSGASRPLAGLNRQPGWFRMSWAHHRCLELVSGWTRDARGRMRCLDLAGSYVAPETQQLLNHCSITPSKHSSPLTNPCASPTGVAVERALIRIANADDRARGQRLVDDSKGSERRSRHGKMRRYGIAPRSHNSTTGSRRLLPPSTKDIG